MNTVHLSSILSLYVSSAHSFILNFGSESYMSSRLNLRPFRIKREDFICFLLTVGLDLWDT
jgi:hypothetical protein